MAGHTQRTSISEQLCSHLCTQRLASFTSCLLRRRLVTQLGEGNWSRLVTEFPGRIGKQLRERWNHELRPDITKAAWTPDEEVKLVHEHRRTGNSWADIARVRPASLC